MSVSIENRVKNRIAIERKIARKAIRLLAEAGWKVVGHNATNDGSFEACEGEKEAMEALFSVDECHLFFKKGALRRQWIFFVLGNSGWDVINDHTAPPEGDAEYEFCQIMAEISKYTEKFEV